MQQQTSQTAKSYEAPKVVVCGSITDLTNAPHIKADSPEPSTGTSIIPD